MNDDAWRALAERMVMFGFFTWTVDVSMRMDGDGALVGEWTVSADADIDHTIGTGPTLEAALDDWVSLYCAGDV